MLYQLRKLSSSEQESMVKSPIWVTLLVACADLYISDSELKKAKEIVHVKTFSETNDVKNLYIELEKDIDHSIEEEILKLPQNGLDRVEYLNQKISALNNILPKLEHTYALQFYKSLKDLALYVAKSEGGFLGVGDIADSEIDVISLPMLKKP